MPLFRVKHGQAHTNVSPYLANSAFMWSCSSEGRSSGRFLTRRGTTFSVLRAFPQLITLRKANRGILCLSRQELFLLNVYNDYDSMSYASHEGVWFGFGFNGTGHECGGWRLFSNRLQVVRWQLRCMNRQQLSCGYIRQCSLRLQGRTTRR